jgi:hypothetical protein
MGQRGPLPKRSDQRHGHGSKAAQEAVTKARGTAAVEQPAGDPDWHPIARDWYASLAVSGQSAFYQPSDWQTARFVAESMDRNLRAGRFSAQQFAATMSAMTELLTTEGARRRARLELQNEQPAPKQTRPSSRDRLQAV